MKLLYIITGLGMGGAEHVVVNLADALAKEGHQIKIIYLTGEAIVLPTNPKIEVLSASMKSSKDLLKAYLFIRKVVKTYQPDVIHSHMFHSNIISRLLRLSIKVPLLISTAHSNNEGNSFRMLIYRLTDWLADISTNVSKDAVQEFINRKAVNKNKIIAIANGVDTGVFRKLNVKDSVRSELELSESDKLILCVGRLDIPKDYPNLFTALSILKNTRQDFKVIIVGDGPLKQELQELVTQLNISNFVSFLGIRRDIPRLMSASDIFVLPSKWEGFGLVVAEAMACECLVVATECGGVKEVMEDNGFLVPTRNPEALASMINLALNVDSQEKLQVGLKARKHIIENYSLKSNVNSYLSLYKP